MKKLLSLLLCAAILLLPAAAMAESEKKHILIGQDASPAPIGWINEDGSVDGFDRAVINAVAELLPQYEFEVEVTDFQGLFSGVDSGRYDIIVDNLSYKPERAERYLYSTEYYMWNTTVIAFQKGRTDINGIADLGGKSMVTAANGAFNQLFAENYNDAHQENPIKITYSDQALLVTYQQIADGQVDFAIQELASLLTYMDQFGIELDYLVPSQQEQTEMQDPAGYWLFPMTDEGAQIRDDVDGAFRTLKENGTLEKLAVQYFGFNIFEGLDN